VRRQLFIIATCLSFNAYSYSSDELLGDCKAAVTFHTENPNPDPYQTMRGARCTAYVTGFADGYQVSNYLAEKIGVSLNAICLPNDENLPYRLVRSVLTHLERLPPNSPSNSATLVAAALSKTFPCADQLESKK
jgi:hypothetical protein